MTALTFRPWDVWWVDFDPVKGSEQGGRRSCIIVGTAVACRIPNGVVQVVPTAPTLRGLEWQPVVTIAGEKRAVMVDQIRTLSERRFQSLVRGTQLSQSDIHEIRDALKLIINVQG